MFGANELRTDYRAVIPRRRNSRRAMGCSKMTRDVVEVWLNDKVRGKNLGDVVETFTARTPAGKSFRTRWPTAMTTCALVLATVSNPTKSIHSNKSLVTEQLSFGSLGCVETEPYRPHLYLIADTADCAVYCTKIEQRSCRGGVYGFECFG
jgi:hypothetical protein